MFTTALPTGNAMTVSFDELAEVDGAHVVFNVKQVRGV
jgi:hypothetical protein